MLQGTSHRPIIHVTVSVSVRNCVQELVLPRLVANLVLLPESWPCWSLQTSSWNTLTYQWVPASREQEWTMDIHGTILDGIQVSNDRVSTLPLDANTPAVEVKLQAWSKSHPQSAPCSRGYRHQQKATEESHLRCPGQAQLMDLPSLQYLAFSSFSPGMLSLLYVCDSTHVCMNWIRSVLELLVHSSTILHKFLQWECAAQTKKMKQ